MDRARYEAIKAAHLARDKAKRKKKMGAVGHLAKKIGVRRKYFAKKRKAVDRNFEGRKNAKINREHGKWSRKSAKWDSKGVKWGLRWAHKSAKFNASVKKYLPEKWM